MGIQSNDVARGTDVTSLSWTEQELRDLKLCLSACGVGRWRTILQVGLLPGKQVAQLYGATQRLLGIQSLAAYSGQCLDLNAVQDYNAKQPGLRKAGLLTRESGTMSKAEREALQRDAAMRFALGKGELRMASSALASRILQCVDKSGNGIAAVHAATLLSRHVDEVPVRVSALFAVRAPVHAHPMRVSLVYVPCLIGGAEWRTEASVAGSTKEMSAVERSEYLRLLKRVTLALTRDGGVDCACGPSCAAACLDASATAAVPQADRSARSGDSAPGSSVAARPAAKPKRKRRRLHGAPRQPRNEGPRVPSTVRQAHLKQLHALGFSEAKAEDALDAADWDLDKAVEFLLMACT